MIVRESGGRREARRTRPRKGAGGKKKSGDERLAVCEEHGGIVVLIPDWQHGVSARGEKEGKGAQPQRRGEAPRGNEAAVAAAAHMTGEWK